MNLTQKYITKLNYFNHQQIKKTQMKRKKIDLNIDRNTHIQFYLKEVLHNKILWRSNIDVALNLHMLIRSNTSLETTGISFQNTFTSFSC